jgi:sugar O-acyltransferase (sialic acid O-acetyltransferase NeuD family)
MMNKPLLIFGSGSLARLALYYAKMEMGLTVLGFVVDSDKQSGDEFCDLPVFTWDAFILQYSPDEVCLFIAVGYKSMRGRGFLFERARSSGYTLQNLVSSSFYSAQTVHMGENNFIMPGVVIEPGVTLGDNNVIWSNTTICHDSIIGNHNFFAAKTTVGGEVSVGDCCFLGFSSTVVHHLTICDDVLLAAQSLLLDDADRLGWYQGVPARRMKEFSPVIGVSF